MVRKRVERGSSTIRRIAGLDNLEVLDVRLRGYTFPQHFHETLVIEWVTAGSDHCTISGKSAHAEQLFVHGPGVAHTGGSEDGGELAYRACYPSVELAMETLDLPGQELRRLGTRVLHGRAVRQAAEQLFGALDLKTDVDRARVALQQVLLRAFDQAASDVVEVSADDTCHTDHVRIARDHLRANLDREVTSAELAEFCGLSRFHLLREFKRVLGITPRQYVISQRVLLARQLLSAGMPIAEVALACGFTDQSHLTRHFKRVTTYTPGQLKSASMGTDGQLRIRRTGAT